MSNMQGWDLDSGNGGNTQEKQEFIKFPEGVTRMRVITPQPHIRWVHWMNQHKRSVNCPGKGCPICEIRRQQKANGENYTYNMTKRFSVQVINRENNQLEILDQGVTFFQDLKDVLQDFVGDTGKTIHDLDVKVRRRGTSKDNTSYRIDPDKDYTLTEADQELLKKQIDLADYFQPHTVEQVLDLVNGKPWDEVMKYENTDNNTEQKNNSNNNDGDEVGEEIEIR